ncbi:MAG: 4-hydroxy-tetrahydrodipicolinate reductase [Methylobacteriaceae bacterium]|jgi:4-hydroxy-tetrahydrodipicolinate reductase|nr:4-hydroxy-tetrahydrodipicolinate reductase [Methylobacteriaceae bacterium]
MKLVVAGAAGRMGRMLVKAIAGNPQVMLSAAIEQPGSRYLGQDAGVLAGVEPLNVPVTDDALEAFVAADGVLDFTTPAATVAFAGLAAQARIVHVIGTTGLNEADKAKLIAAARHARIVQSGNMSLGVNLLTALVRKAAAVLGPEFDIEILEMHHNKKVDAPSGTALMLGESAAAGRGMPFSSEHIPERLNKRGARTEGEIGFAALRGGTVVGEHVVIFAGKSERLELAHRAEDRGIFANGALTAALWAFPQKPGYYTMADVLGLSAL